MQKLQISVYYYKKEIEYYLNIFATNHLIMHLNCIIISYVVKQFISLQEEDHHEGI